MTETKTLTEIAEPVPADWGWYVCQKLASEAEMTAVAHTCTSCHKPFAAKVGGGITQGCRIGTRSVVDTAWTWGTVVCRDCEFDFIYALSN